jgi:hypothetical protein
LLQQELPLLERLAQQVRLAQQEVPLEQVLGDLEEAQVLRRARPRPTLTARQVNLILTADTKEKK